MSGINKPGVNIPRRLEPGTLIKTQSRKTFFKKTVCRIINFFAMPWGRQMRSETLGTAEKTVKSMPGKQLARETTSRWLFRQTVENVVNSHADMARQLSGNTNIDLKQVTGEVTKAVLRAKELKAEGNCDTALEGLRDEQLILLATVVTVVENHTDRFEKTMVLHNMVSSLSEKLGQHEPASGSDKKSDKTTLGASPDSGYNIQNFSEPVETANNAEDFSSYTLAESMKKLLSPPAN